jgi:NADH-quinone oxidoreductase subunit C
MTRVLDGRDVGQRIEERFPDAVVDVTPEWVVVAAEKLVEAATFLRDDAEMDFAYLISVVGVDRLDHFEVVYHLQSFKHNQMMVLKTRALDHTSPEVPSLTPVWKGAELQEREVYDLMGIRFAGHPDLRRMFLWDGFPGHPLRKDWLGMPSGQVPGLGRFPREAGEGSGR